MFTVCGAGYTQKVYGDPINPVSVDLQYDIHKVLFVQYFNVEICTKLRTKRR